jgi:hypothetical protein
LRPLSRHERVSNTDGNYVENNVVNEVAVRKDDGVNVDAEEGGRAMTTTQQLVDDRDDNVFAVGVCADVWGGI